MKDLQLFADKTAMGLSLLCLFHCLAFPLIVVLLPIMAAIHLNDTAIHIWLLLAVVPISAYALTTGCKKHKHYRPLILGFSGLACLILDVTLIQMYSQESGYREIAGMMLSPFGAGLVAYAHYRNYRICQNYNNGAGPENSARPSK